MTRLFRILTCAALALLAAAPLSAQIGRRFPSEKKVIKDPKTGVELVFLTSQQGMGDSKIYQTHNQWTSDGKWVIFRSNRVPGEAMAVNEQTGEMVQVTEGGYSGMLCVARNSMHLYIQRPDMTEAQKAEQQALYQRRRAGEQVDIPRYDWQVVEIDLEKLFKDSAAGRLKKKDAYERICGIIPAEMCSEGDMALDGSEEVAYFRLDKEFARKYPIAEQIAPNFGPRNMGAGPGGIGKIDLKTGKAEPVVAVHFKVGHIQGNPWHPGEVIFCWETGGKAPQRTWMVNADGSNLRPIYRETEYDWVTHEAVISADELVIAILGHRKIAEGARDMDTTKDWGPSGTKEYPTGIAVVNMRTRELTLEGQVDGDNFWHVAGSQDGHWVAGDDFARELWLVDRHTKERILLTAGHKTTAQDHVHPTFKPDGTEIEIQSAMLSEDNRSMNICIVRLPQELIDRYKK
ncbi:MAG: oligogalacturonate lyase family protein [Bacteroidales bacterium]|nr:oligogalacturonate lyase family protein [Bacteroidales bacterium]